jgi:hypothetical protein
MLVLAVLPVLFFVSLLCLHFCPCLEYLVKTYQYLCDPLVTWFCNHASSIWHSLVIKSLHHVQACFIAFTFECYQIITSLSMHPSLEYFDTTYLSLCDYFIILFWKHASSLLYSYVINSSHHLASLLHFRFWAKYISIYVINLTHFIGSLLHPFYIGLWSVHHII